MTAPEIALMAHTTIACVSLSAMLFVLISILADMKWKVSGWRRGAWYFMTALLALVSFVMVTRIPAPVSVLLLAQAIIIWKVRKRLIYSVTDEKTRESIKAAYTAAATKG